MLSRRKMLAGLMAARARADGATGDPADLTVIQAREAIRRKRLTPLELTQACLRRIEQHNPKLNTMIAVLADEAISRAKSLSPAMAATQPLHGIPIVLKDLFDVKGIRTTAASAQWRDHIADRDAAVVERLRASGAILVGKANMDEFAYNFTSETSVFGPSRNPWNPECSPGGSSGGSAIAVATGMCLAALGSDTGGSIRLPAAFCGVVGFKPAYGSVPVTGAVPLSWSLDHVGPLTRTALDALLVHEVLSGSSVPIPKIARLRIGVVREPYCRDLQPSVEEALTQAIEVFQGLGHTVRDVNLPPLPSNPVTTLPTAYSTVIFAEAYTFHREMLNRHSERYHPGTRATLEIGRGISAADYIAARRDLERLRASAPEQLFAGPGVDILLTPTAPGPAFRLASQPSLLFLRNTSPWNLYGLPTISFPCGFSPEGLPIGLQLTGAPERTATVLSLAAHFEQAAKHHLKRPPLL